MRQRRATATRFLALALWLGACGGSSDHLGPRPTSSSVHLTVTDFSMGINESRTMVARDAGQRPIAGSELQWSSSNATIATVSPAGLVVGVAPGEVDIQVQRGSYHDTVRITVLPIVSLGEAQPHAINAAGWVVGLDAGRPFIWSSTTGIHLLPGLAGAVLGVATGIGDHGDVVGESGSDPDNMAVRAVVWPVTPIGLGVPEDLPWNGGPASSARGVSPAGNRIVGVVFTHPSPTIWNSYPAIWTRVAGGAWSIELLPLPAGAYGFAMVVNDAGQVAGSIDTPGSAGYTSDAVVWHRRVDLTWTYDILASGAISTTRAFGMNAAGEIAGMHDDRAVTWKQNGHAWIEQDLGVPVGTRFSWASGINDAGTVVGTRTDASGLQRAFVWDVTGGMRELDGLSIYSELFGINAQGVAVGYSHDSRSTFIGAVWLKP